MPSNQADLHVAFTEKTDFEAVIAQPDHVWNLFCIFVVLYYIPSIVYYIRSILYY